MMSSCECWQWSMRLYASQWCYIGCDGISNHQPCDCLFNCLFRGRSKKTSKLHITGLCVRNDVIMGYGITRPLCVNSSAPGKNRCHFTDDIFRCIFMHKKSRILIKISLNFVPDGPFDNKWVLVQIMTWHWSGDKALSELMLTRFIDTYFGH